MYLPEMTWQEVDRVDRGTVVVVPFGAMEQHSLHLPIETDALLAAEVSRRLDAAFDGRLLVLPVQWLGLSLHHLDFPGTLSATPGSCLGMAEDVLESVSRAGFRTVLILNAHGGNSAILDVVLASFQSRHQEMRIVAVTYWKLASEEIAALRDSPAGGMGHACELETSLVLAVKPSVVRREHLSQDGQWPASRFLEQDMLAPGVATVWENYALTSRHGGRGDPTAATAEKGERFLAVIAGRLSELVRELQGRPVRPPSGSSGAAR